MFTTKVHLQPDEIIILYTCHMDFMNFSIQLEHNVIIERFLRCIKTTNKKLCK